MGIRIHKLIGYGLTDVRCDDEGRIIDERFADDGYMRADAEAQENDWTLAGFDKWLEGRYGKFGENMEELAVVVTRHAIQKSIEADGDSPMWRCFVHDGEFGLPSVFVAVAPCFGRDWQRYDDIIDYVEETHRSYDVSGRAEELDQGIYPYAGHADRRDGRKVMMDEAYALLRLAPGKVPPDEVEIAVAARETLAQKMGFASADEAHVNLTPRVPEDIVLLCEYCKVFAKPETVYQLRPLLYVYWS